AEWHAVDDLSALRSCREINRAGANYVRIRSGFLYIRRRLVGGNSVDANFSHENHPPPHTVIRAEVAVHDPRCTGGGQERTIEHADGRVFQFLLRLEGRFRQLRYRWVCRILQDYAADGGPAHSGIVDRA